MRAIIVALLLMTHAVWVAGLGPAAERLVAEVGGDIPEDISMKFVLLTLLLLTGGTSWAAGPDPALIEAAR
ncbi:MAG: hypothetical protein EXR07_11790 [Acetobacteraceae bacterium]|nr:hypothetical protein [Acetobacteraceae bacterium]